MSGGSRSDVDLYWLPLGARGHFLRIGGKLFEATAARLEHREARDIYHSVLEVRVPEGRFVIEMGPVADSDGAGRGVVAEGSVGARWAGRLRILRYEVRCWHAGVTAYNHAVESPRRLTDDEAAARRVLDFVRLVPTPVWGRDELRAGEMWCCNSLTSWLLMASGLAVESIQPPAGGRAPGWKAGLVTAHRGGPSTANRMTKNHHAIPPRSDGASPAGYAASEIEASTASFLGGTAAAAPRPAASAQISTLPTSGPCSPR